MSKILSEILTAIADDLNITPSQYGAIERAYNSVADWLNRNDSRLNKYKVSVYPQGSMRLGTVVKPLKEDDYDVDVVCLLTQNSHGLAERDVKHLVGDRLCENAIYKSMLGEEGKRCWTLTYSDDLNFHMDILPAIPYTNEALQTYRELNALGNVAIKATHKKSDGTYVFIPTNPGGYAEWFKQRMHDYTKAQFARGSIQELPEFPVKTPLQMTIQLLKRHRDVIFESDESGVAPIPIIITTLAAKAYKSEGDVYTALCNIVGTMESHMDMVNGVIWVRNPVLNNENFAEKWVNEPKKKDAFFAWLKKVKADVASLKDIQGIDQIGKKMKELFGQKVVDRTLNEYGAFYKKLRDAGLLTVSAQTTNISIGSGVTIKPHSFHGK